MATGIVELGDIVKDTLIGDEGIVISRHEYINGCLRWELVSRPKKGDAKTWVVDDQFCELVKKGKITTSKSHQARLAQVTVDLDKPAKRPGGPRDAPGLSRMMSR